MKGIREMAMSKGDDDSKKEKQSSLFRRPYKGSPTGAGVYDLDDDYGYGYPTSFDDIDIPISYNNSYSQVKRPDFTINVTIKLSEIGSVADDASPRYNYDEATRKAEEMAYDRIASILKDDFESKYTMSFQAYEGMIDYEVRITFTKNES